MFFYSKQKSLLMPTFAEFPRSIARTKASFLGLPLITSHYLETSRKISSVLWFLLTIKTSHKPNWKGYFLQGRNYMGDILDQGRTSVRTTVSYSKSTILLNLEWFIIHAYCNTSCWLVAFAFLHDSTLQKMRDSKWTIDFKVTSQASHRWFDFLNHRFYKSKTWRVIEL